MDLWLVFLTGLTIGGLTCMAVQGGLLASTIAIREREDLKEGSYRKHKVWPVLAFLSAKFIAYALLGFALGAFGSILSLSDNVRIIMQLVAGIYMVAIALNLLNIHPIFRYAVIQPPRFLAKLIRNQSRSEDLFAPALLGAMTIFIPCGTTLAMEALAISSGSPLAGSAIMAVFVLGTSPLFFGLGFVTTFLGDTFRNRFLKLAAVLVFYLGVTTTNSALVLAGSPITLQVLAEASPIQIDLKGEGVVQDLTNIREENGVQVADITVFPTGYSPSFIRVKSGELVRLNLQTSGKLGCTSVFTIPKLQISKVLPINASDSVEFTPTTKGKLTWACSMGMYTGTIEVI